MRFATSLLAYLLVFGCYTSHSQTIPVGTPVLEEQWRRLQLKGEKDPAISFTIRPITEAGTLLKDSTGVKNDTTGANQSSKALSFAKGRGRISVLPLTINQQYNSRHPYGWNDGSMIPARGYQNQISGGLYSKIGPLSVQLRPEFVYAENKSFSTFSLNRDQLVAKTYYTTVLNQIDAPEYFGAGTYTRLFPGQSSIRLNYKKLSLGISTENLWWGPSIRNSLIMSNNAPGFPHITFNTSSPIHSPIGSFEWQLIGGTLKGSSVLPSDTGFRVNGERIYIQKNDDDRYLNGIVVTWQPKWTKGLHLGFSRVFYLYKSDIASSIDGYLPVIGNFFKNNTQNEDEKNRDQMAAVFFRLTLPKEKAEVYGEFARNDHSGNLRDLLLEPEHASAYILGLRKLFDVDKHTNLEVMTEFANLEVSMTSLLRELSSWYAHGRVRHGYTNYGQVMGAGIGTGGKSQTVSVNYLQEKRSAGISFERVVRNNDFYYAAFTPMRDFSSHWVDLSVNLNACYQVKRFIYKGNLSRVKSLNYQWQQDNDAKTWHLQFSTSFIL